MDFGCKASRLCVRVVAAPRKTKRTFTFVGEKRDQPWGGWFRNVRLVNGQEILVGLRKGSRTRGMYGVKGFAWHGVVQDKGRTMWSGRVAKSCGVEGMLAASGLLADHSVCQVRLRGSLDKHGGCVSHRCRRFAV